MPNRALLFASAVAAGVYFPWKLQVGVGSLARNYEGRYPLSQGDSGAKLAEKPLRLGKKPPAGQK